MRKWSWTFISTKDIKEQTSRSSQFCSGLIHFNTGAVWSGYYMRPKSIFLWHACFLTKNRNEESVVSRGKSFLKKDSLWCLNILKKLLLDWSWPKSATLDIISVWEYVIFFLLLLAPRVVTRILLEDLANKWASAMCCEINRRESEFLNVALHMCLVDMTVILDDVHVQ